MRKIWTVFFFLMVGFTAQGQEIRGVVMNLLGQPVRGTEISVSGFDKKATTSESGDFKIELEVSFEEVFGY
ncbi:MAG: hypothetical protein ACI9FU_001747, partial [Granulosicoccus sp.]